MSRSFSSSKRPISCRCRPNDFDSRMPLTLSVSSVIEVMSAIVFWVLVDTSRRARPTLTVSHRNSGISSKESSVSGTESSNIAISVLMIVTTLASTLEAVSVTTDLHATHVVGEPRLDLAGARGREESQRHELQVRVERVAQVLHHAQAHQVRHVGLPDADDAGDDRDRRSSGRRRRTAAGGWDRLARRSRWSSAGSPNSALLKTFAISSGLTTPNPEVMTIASATTATFQR